jgi:hypothetical protein
VRTAPIIRPITLMIHTVSTSETSAEGGHLFRSVKCKYERKGHCTTHADNTAYRAFLPNAQLTSRLTNCRMNEDLERIR